MRSTNTNVSQRLGRAAGPQAAVCIAFLIVTAIARGDGGTVRLMTQSSGYQITAFTSPTPVWAGSVDISVFVQDAATGEPVPAAQVNIGVRSLERTDMALQAARHGERCNQQAVSRGPVRFAGTGEMASHRCGRRSLRKCERPIRNRRRPAGAEMGIALGLDRLADRADWLIRHSPDSRPAKTRLDIDSE